MATIFEKFAKSWHIYFFNTLGVENFDEIALSLTVKEIEAILCFAHLSIFGQNKKIAIARLCNGIEKQTLYHLLPTILTVSDIMEKPLYLQ